MHTSRTLHPVFLNQRHTARHLYVMPSLSERRGETTKPRALIPGFLAWHFLSVSFPSSSPLSVLRETPRAVA